MILFLYDYPHIVPLFFRFSSMQTFLITLVIVLLLGLGGLILYLLKKLQQATAPKDGERELFAMLQSQIQEQSRSVQDLSKTLDAKLTSSTQSTMRNQQHLQTLMQEQFAQNSKLIQGISGQSNHMIAKITEKLTSLDKTNQQVIGFSEQLKNLEKVLTSQKQRGNLGEAGLQLVLDNILPPTAFSLQYQFEDGDTVDAAIFTKDGIIPVDSKFPLDNYDRLIHEEDKEKKLKLENDFKNDLKKRIDETSKYIKPAHNTLEFAFMFIPAEAIYYDLLVNEVGAVKVNTRNLIDYAFNEKKVIIVSPTTFAAYLQTVLQGLRAFKIEEGAKEIRKHVELLGKHLNAYESYMEKLGNAMGTTVNHYNKAYKELNKIDKDVMKITGSEKSITPITLDKPESVKKIG